MRTLPPGPDLGRVTQGVRFHRDPLGFLRRMRDEHGDVFSLRLAIAGPMTFVTDPAAAAQIVDVHPSRGHGGEARWRIVRAWWCAAPSWSRIAAAWSWRAVASCTADYRSAR
jgi:cytochrome P450